MQPGPYPSPASQYPVGTIDQQVRPAKSWFVVAALIGVVGIIIAVVILARSIGTYADRIDDFDRALLPATLEVEIADTGGYSIYHEYDGADGDYGFAYDPDVTVTDPSGDLVPLDDYVGSVTYSASGHEGEGLFTFAADEPGAYQVSATGDTGSGIAVGRGVGRGLVGAILGSLAIGTITVLAGAVLAIVVGVRRSGSRRALMPTPAFGGWNPPQPPGWGGPPAQGWGGPPAPGWGGPGGYGPPPPPRQPPLPPPPPPPPGGGSAATGLTPGITDPPSLGGPLDWSRGDVPLPWMPQRR